MAQSSHNSNAPDERKTQLEDLMAKATLKYSTKDFIAAADLYSQATELQSEINGEMSSQNADVLYAYGRCLYHVAVRKSDVLGSKVAGGKQDSATKTPDPIVRHNHRDSKPPESQSDLTEARKEPVRDSPQDNNSAPQEPEADNQNKPYFQFTGDENFDDSDAEGDVEGADEDGEGADEEDDFANAFEVLDLARVLLLKRLDEFSSNGTKDEQQSLLSLAQLKERLADTYDLQAEISLEGERFPSAVEDLKASLGLKKELFPSESSLIAEAHYKLSLALEFSSVMEQKNEAGGADHAGVAHYDKTMREEAAKEMEAAIASCKMRINKEEAGLGAGLAENGKSNDEPKLSTATQQEIDDVKDMVKDMEQRLVELRQPPISVSGPSGIDVMSGDNPLGGILSSMLGESATSQQAKLEEASKGAKDLTELVIKRKKAGTETHHPTQEADSPRTGDKKKLEFVEEVAEAGTDKKTKFAEDGEQTFDTKDT
ncbi:MAG: hypothetical protein LQ342_001540 [Letrouitia transgressa]|nr:MAG: hypothetical protein LQ342_001540 [Letrouitia transgressa]